jgi:hypothetical protein
MTKVREKGMGHSAKDHPKQKKSRSTASPLVTKDSSSKPSATPAKSTEANQEPTAKWLPPDAANQELPKLSKLKAGDLPYNVLITDLVTGEETVEVFEDCLAMVARLQELVGNDYKLRIYQGLPCYISKPPFRYVVYPDGAVTPLFTTPSFDDIEIEESGIVSDNFYSDPTAYHGDLNSTEDWADSQPEAEYQDDSPILTGSEYDPLNFGKYDHIPPWEDIPTEPEEPADDKEIPGPGFQDEGSTS